MSTKIVGKWYVVKHNCVPVGVFSDYNGQLHVSASTGHLQVVLGELNLRSYYKHSACTWYRDLYIHSLVFSFETRAWQEPEPSHVAGMALAHCILGTFLGVVCHCFLPPLDVPTLVAMCLRSQRRERS